MHKTSANIDGSINQHRLNARPAFFNEVRVRDDHRLGDPGQGWTVASPEGYQPERRSS